MGSVTEAVCSDPMVIVSPQASEKTKELWYLHGHPHSKRYSDPSFVTLGALVRHNAKVYKDDVAVLYPTYTGGDGYSRLSWGGIDQATENVAGFYGRQLKAELAESKASGKQPTVALLGSGTTIGYFVTELALQKLNVRVLLLAETIALDALHHLLNICEAKAILMDKKSAGAYSGDIRKFELVEDLSQLDQAAEEEVTAMAFEDDNPWERHSFIIHTSGSTGMPKKVVHTNRSMMLIARMYRLFPDFYSENWYLLFPLYHIAGISIALSGLPNGQILTLPPLTWPPSSSAVFAGLKELSSMGFPVDLIHCAPVLIENFYDYILETTKDFSPLSNLKVLQPGGAALAPEIIKGLVANGVNVKTTYGSTEIGPPFRSIPHSKENPKCYSLRNLYPDNPLLEMQEIADGLYECIVYKGFELAAELWENSDEPYRTNDLFIQEPPGSGFYVLQGRKDDILVHTNGENTSAGPLQLDIQTACKAIRRCIALGHSRPVVSLLVEADESYDPSSPETEEEIWQCVKAANEKFPGHSRIMRSMICILPKGKELPVTPKGNVKRKLAEELYIREVDSLYDEVSEPFVEDIRNGNEGSLRDYIRDLVAQITKFPASELKDWMTFYELGLDSRDALSLRSGLSKRVGKFSLGTIFENPSVSQLTAFFEKKEKAAESESKAQDIKRMVEKYCAELKTWPKTISKKYDRSEDEVILLTGGTGSLGTALLEILTGNLRVKKIVAMVRGENQMVKLAKAFQDRGIDAKKIFASGKVETVNYSMQDPLLGIDIETYYRLANEVTIVLQNAWKVDFNLPVEQFQDDCIRNTMNLLRFCIAGRLKQFAFTSSMSTSMGSGMKSVKIPEAPLGDDPTVALTTGYAQSKYVIERVTQTAAEQLAIPIHLLRVGQLCGSTTSGLWNTSEMWPIMFSTSVSLKALPSLPSKSVDWIPVDTAAQVISDIVCSSDSSTYSVHNIVNPCPISWEALVNILKQILGLEIIGIKEWVERLQDVGEMKEIVGMKLLDMFEGMVGDEEVSKIFETDKTKKVSQALRDCPAVGEAWMRKYVEQWKKGGFMA